MADSLFNIMNVIHAQEQLNLSRRKLEPEVNLFDVVRELLELTEKQKQENKAKWMPLFKIIHKECSYDNRPFYTLDETRDLLLCKKKGSKIIVHCAHSLIRFELQYHSRYILNAVNSVAKEKVREILYK